MNTGCFFCICRCFFVVKSSKTAIQKATTRSAIKQTSHHKPGQIQSWHSELLQLLMRALTEATQLKWPFSTCKKTTTKAVSVSVLLKYLIGRNPECIVRLVMLFKCFRFKLLLVQRSMGTFQQAWKRLHNEIKSQFRVRDPLTLHSQKEHYWTPDVRFQCNNLIPNISHGRTPNHITSILECKKS